MRVITDKIIVKMYLMDKLSVAQISNLLRASPYRVRHVLEKNKVSKRNISEAITQLNITKFGKKPFRLRQELSAQDDDLKLAGIMLYWGEGSKTGNEVGFSNSDPEMIRLFLLFLRRICGVDEARIKIVIHMYPDQDKDFLENFWASITKIDKKRFYPTYVHEGKRGTYKNKSQYGTIGIKYADKKLLKLILEWIREYRDGLLRIVPE